MSVPAPHGVLVVDKPRGPTSHDVVARLRHALSTRRVGHAGTLDPMATGVLVVAVGEATKLVPYLTATDKSYEAELTLGTETDTLDAEGKATAHGAPPAEVLEWAASWSPGSPLLASLGATLALERSRREQVPPAFSALHVDGERSHELARRGEAVALPPRPVEVRDITLSWAGVEEGAVRIALTVDVGKGYYVRSLARDLGRALGTYAHLSALRRVRSGAFSLDEAAALDASPADLTGRLIPLASAATRALPRAVLAAPGLLHARAGRALSPSDFTVEPPPAGPAAWLDGEGVLVAVGEQDGEGRGRVLRGFVAP